MSGKSTQRVVVPLGEACYADLLLRTDDGRPMNGVITLGEMQAKGMTMLEVACRRCERRGRLRIERAMRARY